MNNSHNTVVINKGESVQLKLRYENEDKTPIDLTGATLGIQESFPPGLMAGVVQVEGDPLDGHAALFIPSSISALMSMGSVNWLRVFMETVSEVKDVSPKIWIDVQ